MTNEQLVELLQMGVDVKKNMESLYQQNKTIITKICKPYAQTEPLEDLLQQSYFGLVEAVRRYDASAGYKFMSYSQYWIEQSIRKYLISSGRLIKIPSYMNNLIFRYRRFLSAYGADHAGLLPSDEEIRQELGIDRKQLNDLKRYVLYNDVRSIDSPIDESAGENTLQDYIASPDNMEESVIDEIYRLEMQDAVREAMKIALTEPEQDTIKAYYWHNETLASIADHKNITKERVRQQLAQAQRKLSRGKAGKILKGYAEIESMRYVGGLSFFKQYGSIVEYEVLRKEEVLHNARTRYENMKKQEQERFEKRLAELRAI